MEICDVVPSVPLGWPLGIRRGLVHLPLLMSQFQTDLPFLSLLSLAALLLSGKCQQDDRRVARREKGELRGASSEFASALAVVWASYITF